MSVSNRRGALALAVGLLVPVAAGAADEFARAIGSAPTLIRLRADGTAEPDADEPKCRRNSADTSTARLFPARPSPDIDNLGGAIR